MAARIAAWREEHVRFAKLLDALEAQLDRFHRAERPDYGLCLDVMRYMRRYADASHHPREDLAFAQVAEREPEWGELVSQLLHEHAEIDETGERLVELLEGALDGSILPRAELEKPGREYIRRMRSHMHAEETLFPSVTKWLKAADWAAIDRAVPKLADPLVSARPGDGDPALRALVGAAHGH